MEPYTKTCDEIWNCKPDAVSFINIDYWKYLKKETDLKKVLDTTFL